MTAWFQINPVGTLSSENVRYLRIPAVGRSVIRTEIPQLR